MSKTIKSAVESFLGREVSLDEFRNYMPEIVMMEITFSNGDVEKVHFNKNEIEFFNKFNNRDMIIVRYYENNAELYSYKNYYVNYDNDAVSYINIMSGNGQPQEALIEDIKCFNKSQVSIEDLIEYYNGFVCANVFEDTDNFQLKFKLKEKQQQPGFITDEQMAMKIGHLKEELNEIEAAFKNKDLAECADGLMDLIYVAAGLANLMNLPCDLLWKDVQNSNMAFKERVTSLENATKRGSTFDVRKTKDWIAPRGKELIENAS